MINDGTDSAPCCSSMVGNLRCVKCFLILILYICDLTCRCNPCGRGTRCISCGWLVEFCGVYDSNNTDHATLPFKLPYIEMFEDIKTGIIEGDFSPLAIPEFFETTSSILFRECKNCGSDEDKILSVA